MRQMRCFLVAAVACSVAAYSPRFIPRDAEQIGADRQLRFERNPLLDFQTLLAFALKNASELCYWKYRNVYKLDYL